MRVRALPTWLDLSAILSVALIVALFGAGCGDRARDDSGGRTDFARVAERPEPTAHAAKGFAIVDLRGAPVRHVEVEFLFADGRAVFSNVVTSRDGHVEFPSLRSGAESARLSKSGWQTQTWPLKPMRAANERPRVTLHPTTALVVRAEGKSREPVAGVRIEMRFQGQVPLPAEGSLSAVTDQQASLRFEGLREGQWRVTASGADLDISGERTVTLAAGAPAEVRIRAIRMDETPVILVDSEGRPAGGASVSHDTTFELDGPRWTAQVLPDGRLRVPGPPSWLPKRLGVVTLDGRRYVATLRPGSSPPAYTLGDAIPERPLEEAVLAGTVTSRAGAPLRAIVVATDATTPNSPLRKQASTRPDGSFQFFDLDLRRVTLQAVLTEGVGFVIGPRSRRSKTHEIDLPRRDVGLEIDTGASIRGTLSDAAGVLVSGATLVFSRAAPDSGDPNGGYHTTVRTDELGAFFLDGLQPGSYRVRPHQHDPGRCPGWVDEIVEPDGRSVSLRCTAPRAIRCVVRDLQSQPVPEVTVRAFSKSDRAKYHSGLTGLDGVLVLSALDPNESYVVQAHLGDLMTTVADPATPGIVDLPIQVDIEPALRIRLAARSGATVTGRGVTVLRHPDTFVCQTQARAGGEIVLPRMPAGRYVVRLDGSDDLQDAGVTVEFPGTREVVLDVKSEGGK